MQCLFIDIASHSGLIACADAQSVVSSQSCDHKIRDGELLTTIQNVLTGASWQHEDLTSLACVIGPGGFTSLRMAVACTNVLADQLHLPSAGIHLSDLLCARVKEEHFLWLHSTKRAELFVRGFGDYASRWPDPTHMMLGDVARNVPQGAPWVGELLPQHADVLRECALKVLVPEDPVQVLPAFLSGISYGTNLLLPWYGRTP
ncbi:MAG: hypothetical protein PHU04_00670 [Candidatus Peribacteraceae bacterium]|nr:hypothetical protein [Candidatus Peribacteraceae bacterium]